MSEHLFQVICQPENFIRETSSKATEASALGALGSVCTDIKQYQNALKYYHQALEISREIANRTIVVFNWVQHIKKLWNR
ncbi:hypothetical protein WA1_14580 [Scytonema hofmannii PCC 7110]|uniref:Uncharacterized protein n=1 Tax=Scytonema hofmannii PCC 7110 TaxID=128403 RepID=A0A139XF40_9CYAN|nr:tetratricopeptide repeat protein [Scytonema hofmannii]KYC43308.1 hypothetical protein WA1_14580 [Scytonema hofmannii PCC 7110]